ncbi:MAG: hypothetical protein AAF108_02530 [Planctomycetota bacterium]
MNKNNDEYSSYHSSNPAAPAFDDPTLGLPAEVTKLYEVKNLHELARLSDHFSTEEIHLAAKRAFQATTRSSRPASDGTTAGAPSHSHHCRIRYFGMPRGVPEGTPDASELGA